MYLIEFMCVCVDTIVVVSNRKMDFQEILDIFEEVHISQIDGEGYDVCCSKKKLFCNCCKRMLKEKTSFQLFQLFSVFFLSNLIKESKNQSNFDSHTLIDDNYYKLESINLF